VLLENDWRRTMTTSEW